MGAYDWNEKGAEFLEAFDDPGPPFDPADGPPDVWFRQVVEHACEFFIAFQHDGTVVYVSEPVEVLLGHTPADLLGTNALDLIHPDDLENAAETVYHAAEVEGWRPSRPFRLRHADGSFATFEVEGMSLFHLPDVRSLVCACRYAESTARVDAIVGLLAAGASLAEILDQLVHVMARPGWRMGVAVQYDDGPGRLALAHTGLPDALVSFDRAARDTPWGRALEQGSLVVDIGLTTLSPDLAHAATVAGFRTCWAFPVPDPGRVEACVVVWNYDLHEPELGQEILLTKFRQLLELALVGRARAGKLEQDARTDPLSGLANRRSFDAALADSGSDDVAIITIDLDGFKAVNDALGHAAGDEVIRTVGARISAAIRDGDLAARHGGDEFAVICRGVRTEDDVTALADRLLATVSQPIDLPEGRAEFGLSMGIAIAAPGSHPDIHHILDVADRQLYQAKQSGKGHYRLAHVAPREP